MTAKWVDLIGLDPDFTGGLGAVEYPEQIRGGSQVTLRTSSEVDPSVSDPTEIPKVPDSTGRMTTGSDR